MASKAKRKESLKEVPPKITKTSNLHAKPAPKSKKKDSLKTINRVKGGSDVSKRKALKGFHIPKVKIGDIQKTEILDNKKDPTFNSKPEKLNSKREDAIPLSNQRNLVSFKIKGGKRETSLQVSRSKTVTKSKKYIQSEIEKDILKDIDVESERGGEREDIFYEDHKRKKPLCRIYSPTTIRTQKEDPPPRSGNIIYDEPPDISSDEDAEEELRDLLEQQLKQSMPPFYSKHKTLLEIKEKNKDDKSFKDKVASPKKRNLVYYTRSSRNGGNAIKTAQAPKTRDKIRKNTPQIQIGFRDKAAPKRLQPILDTTPIAPETPPMPYSENDDSYSNIFEDIDGNAEFSPNTTLSGFQSLNYSLVGSSNEDDGKSSSSKKVNTDDSDDEKYCDKTSQELNASFVDNLRGDESKQNIVEDDIPMDWDATDKTGILTELKQCREDLQLHPSPSGPAEFPENVFDKSLRNETPLSKGSLYVVIDTNIFIAQLRMVEKLFVTFIGSNNSNGSTLKIYVPWAVLDELDNLKTAGKRHYNPNVELEANARKAIAYLHQKLLSKCKMLFGQTQLEEQEAEIYKAHNADDRILRTCLKLKAEGKSVLLYTNDRNLANKSIISGISAFDSTKILQGIADARHEIRSSEKPELLKSQNSVLKNSNPLKSNENFSSKMNETLIPDSDDEEDMMIDSEELFQNEPLIAQKLATVEDLYQLFNDVWFIIYLYTCRYAISLELDLGNNLPSPEIEQLPPHINPKSNFKHLNQLTHGVLQLAKYLNDFLKVSPTTLKVNSRELTNFHGSLTLFLLKLDRFKPHGHAPSPEHPAISPGIMLQFALQPEYREKLNSGVNQLVELRSILQNCKDKASSL